MSASTVITEGYGSSVSSVILQGFGIGDEIVVVTPPASIPSGGWSSGRASYFFGHDRELAKARDRDERRRAKQEARAEVARIAAEAGSPKDAAEELAAIRRAVAAESLAFGAFYRQLLDDAIARLRAEEEARMAAAASLEAERQAIARRRRDEEEVLLLVSVL